MRPESAAALALCLALTHGAWTNKGADTLVVRWAGGAFQ
jgi:hypothetical protein